MQQRRIVVTGMGTISALGKSVDEHWSKLIAGESGIRPLDTDAAKGVSFAHGAEVQDFDPAEHFAERGDREQDRFAQFALIAASEAIEDSGLEWNDGLRDRTAVITGSSCGGQSTMDLAYHRLYAEGKRRLHPHTIPHVMANAGASAIAMRYGFRGPSFTLSTACSSSNHAIGTALMTLRTGQADVALAGGSEAVFPHGLLKAWEAIRVVSPDTCRPYCLERNGMILGEGGAMLLLETLEHAKARGARIYAELAGFGMSSDAHHLTMPSLMGPVRAMRAALDDSGVDATSVGYINGHGTGTTANDANECHAIRELFAHHADRLAISSTKSMHGHTLGAAGALEAVATAMAISTGILPPTANFVSPDPDCELDAIPNEARELRVDAALSNSFAFGGLNAVLVMRRCD